MNSSSKKVVILAVIVLVLGAIYLAFALGTNNTGRASTTSVTGSSTPSTGTGAPAGLISMFGTFSRMEVTLFVNDVPDESVTRQNVSYLTLGHASLNGSDHIKVQFSDPQSNVNAIAWFNQAGGIDRVDVLGERNYTGSGASLYVQDFVSIFSLVPGIANNATLSAQLQKVSETTMSIGPTQMDVITYSLPAATSGYTNVTARFAAVPGSSARWAVYLDEKATDLSETLFQVTSVTRQ